MTTGRINQVTTIPHRTKVRLTAYSRRSVFPTAGVRYKAFKCLSIPTGLGPRQCSAKGILNSRTSQSYVPLFPDLTNFRPALRVRRTQIAAFSEDYQQPAASERCAQSRRIPEWIAADRFSHRQLIHILQHRGHASQKDGVRLS